MIGTQPQFILHCNVCSESQTKFPPPPIPQPPAPPLIVLVYHLRAVTCTEYQHFVNVLDFYLISHSNTHILLCMSLYFCG